MINFIFYFAILGTINSWIINLVYIISYLRLKYNFIAYNLYPFIYIKNNKQKLKFSINILCMFEIYSMVNLNDKLSDKIELDKYIDDTKKVFRNVKITHYILILLGVVIGIFNISLGGLIVSYNMGIIFYQSVGGNENLYDGYIYLSKNLKEENRCEIENNMKREAYLNSQLFLKGYRLYRMYCIYVFKFYSNEEYESIKKAFNAFYEKESKNILFNKCKMFKEDQILLNTCRFNDIKLKEMFDICNVFDSYIEKLNINS